LSSPASGSHPSDTKKTIGKQQKINRNYYKYESKFQFQTCGFNTIHLLLNPRLLWQLRVTIVIGGGV
jgi:hypothetical protein